LISSRTRSPASVIREQLGNSVGPATLRRLDGGPIKLESLRTAIIAAAASS
jgi:hypothetical protein